MLDTRNFFRGSEIANTV